MDRAKDAQLDASAQEKQEQKRREFLSAALQTGLTAAAVSLGMAIPASAQQPRRRLQEGVTVPGRSRGTVQAPEKSPSSDGTKPAGTEADITYLTDGHPLYTAAVAASKTFQLDAPINLELDLEQGVPAMVHVYDVPKNLQGKYGKSAVVEMAIVPVRMRSSSSRAISDYVIAQGVPLPPGKEALYYTHTTRIRKQSPKETPSLQKQAAIQESFTFLCGLAFEMNGEPVQITIPSAQSMRVPKDITAFRPPVFLSGSKRKSEFFPTLVSEEQDSAPAPPPLEGCALAVSPGSRRKNHKSGTVSFTLSGSGPWSASSSKPFATLTPSNGTGGAALTVELSKNQGDTRSAVITVRCTQMGSNATTTVTVRQTSFGDEWAECFWDCAGGLGAGACGTAIGACVGAIAAAATSAGVLAALAGGACIGAAIICGGSLAICAVAALECT